MLKGIIFDFNGTLLWDSAMHEKAWNQIALEYRGKSFSEEEIQNKIHGLTNRKTLEYILGENCDIEEIASRKENIYRKLCCNLDKNFKLAPGAVEFLNILKEKNIPRAIATASGKVNIDFFIEKLDLMNWFTINHIIYDDGSFPGKPEPDIYIKAAESLNLRPPDCMVFEDSRAGIIAAKRAGIGNIIALKSENNLSQFRDIDKSILCVKDFTEIKIENYI
jgi:HAD superfamily hydrolase (TIGR01509 family)